MMNAETIIYVHHQFNWPSFWIVLGGGVLMATAFWIGTGIVERRRFPGRRDPALRLILTLFILISALFFSVIGGM